MGALLPPEAKRISTKHGRPRNGDYVWIYGDHTNGYNVPCTCSRRTRNVGLVMRVNHEDREALVRFFYHKWCDPDEEEFEWRSFDVFEGNWCTEHDGYRVHEDIFG